MVVKHCLPFFFVSFFSIDFVFSKEKITIDVFVCFSAGYQYRQSYLTVNYGLPVSTELSYLMMIMRMISCLGPCVRLSLVW